MTSTFATTDNLNHTANVTGLSDGKSYNYFVRCKDTAGNANTDDYQITFSIASSQQADTTPPVRSDGAPTGILPSGTTQTTLKVTTNEKATCKYSTSSGISYKSMASSFTTSDGLNHSALKTGLSNGKTFNFYVRCKDTAGNANKDDYKITFSVADTTPPVISNVKATLVTNIKFQITWTTDERSSTQAEYGLTNSYGSFTNLGTNLVLSHTRTIGGLSRRTTYHYRVISVDSAGNKAVSGDYTFTTN